MFRVDDIRNRVKRAPFQPLRVTTSAGETFDITHPDLVWIGNRSLMIGLPMRTRPDVFDRYVEVALMHVTSIEDLPTAESAPPSEEKNGAS